MDMETLYQAIKETELQLNNPANRFEASLYSRRIQCIRDLYYQMKKHTKGETDSLPPVTTEKLWNDMYETREEAASRLPLTEGTS